MKRHRWNDTTSGQKCERCKMLRRSKPVKLKRPNKYGDRTAYVYFYKPKGGTMARPEGDRTPACNVAEKPARKTGKAKKAAAA